MADAASAVLRLIAFSDTTRAEPAVLVERFTRLGKRAVPGSVLFVLRDYPSTLRERLALGQRLAELAASTGQRFGLAERADLARALHCTAFHLPGGGLSASDARRYLGPGVFLSRGSHDPRSASEPELDAVLLSPIFEARKGRPALGRAALEEAAQSPTGRAPLLFALGGVSAHNAAACLSAGAAGVAVIGAALAPDPEPLLAALGIARS
ncbi:MAG: thiamine phosphate synthase [Polyangiaceae bacterium]